jgi:hypothetical protein
MEKNKITLLAAAAFLYLVGAMAASCMAALYVNPAKQGVLWVQIYSFSPAALEKDFQVGNRYDFPINISLGMTGNVSSLAELSVKDFSLQPNETKTIDYKLTITDAGVYTGGITIKATAEGKRTNLVYQSDLTVVATKSGIAPEIYGVVIALVLIVIVVVFIRYKVVKKGVRKK